MNILLQKATGGEDEHKNLRKMKMQLLRTRFPEDDVAIKSTIRIDGGVWNLGPPDVKEAVRSDHAVLRDLLKANPGVRGEEPAA